MGFHSVSFLVIVFTKNWRACLDFNHRFKRTAVCSGCVSALSDGIRCTFFFVRFFSYKGSPSGGLLNVGGFQHCKIENHKVCRSLTPHPLVVFLALSLALSHSPIFFYYLWTTKQARADLQFHVSFVWSSFSWKMSQPRDLHSALHLKKKQSSLE